MLSLQAIIVLAASHMAIYYDTTPIAEQHVPIVTDLDQTLHQRLDTSSPKIPEFLFKTWMFNVNQKATG